MNWWPDLLWLVLGTALLLWAWDTFSEGGFAFLLVIWIVGIVWALFIFAMLFNWIGLWVFGGPILLFLA